MSRAEIAQALGCPVETLGNYERGRTFPDRDMLGRMRAVLGVSLDWLLTGEGSMRVVASQPSAGEYTPPPLDEQLFEWIAGEIITLHEDCGQELTAIRLAALAGSWYNDLVIACRSAEERAIGLRVMQQALQRQWREA